MPPDSSSVRRSPQRQMASARRHTVPAGMWRPLESPSVPASRRGPPRRRLRARHPAASRPLAPSARRCGVAARAPDAPAPPPCAAGRAGGPRRRSSPRTSPPPRAARSKRGGSPRSHSSSTSHQQLAAEPLQALRERPVRVVRADRLLRGRAHRPAVESLGEAHDRNARLRVARHDRPLDRRRPAPARQQRGVHVQQRVCREQRLLDQRPEGAHHEHSASRPRHPRSALRTAGR